MLYYRFFWGRKTIATRFFALGSFHLLLAGKQKGNSSSVGSRREFRAEYMRTILFCVFHFPSRLPIGRQGCISAGIKQPAYPLRSAFPTGTLLRTASATEFQWFPRCRPPTASSSTQCSAHIAFKFNQFFASLYPKVVLGGEVQTLSEIVCCACFFPVLF